MYLIQKIKYFIEKICNTSQVTFTLSRVWWENIIINESHEPLIKVNETGKLKIYSIKDLYTASQYVRKNIYERLLTASVSLPDGYAIGVIEGYRSVEQQTQGWNRTIEKIKKEFTNWSEEKIIHEASLVSARPNILANHNCGGAVDVALLYNGSMCNMGTSYPNEHTTMKERRKFPMHTKNISLEQKLNRKILRDAMTQAGFVYYPGEWWHFCYGDRMWAIYTRRKECMYGPIQNFPSNLI